MKRLFGCAALLLLLIASCTDRKYAYLPSAPVEVDTVLVPVDTSTCGGLPHGCHRHHGPHHGDCGP